MHTEIGEQLVGAYLKLVNRCDFVNYNVRPQGGGLDGLGEFDVVGFNYQTDTVYMCEVVTHIRGVQYGTYEQTLKKINAKHERQKKYASTQLKSFKNKVYQVWSPVVPKGKLTDEFNKLRTLEFIINEKYTKCVDELMELARIHTNDNGNDVFRLFQILAVLRRQ